MDRRVKYWISLVLFAVGCVLTVLGADELRGSFGMKELIESGLWKMGIGLPFVFIAGPAFYYYRARKAQSTANDAEISALAALGQKHLDAQENKEPEQKTR